MGNHIAVTQNGKHVIEKKLFVTDKNGKHRKGKKAFLTQNRKHRLVFAAGNDWAKYSCNYTPAYYVEKGAEGSTLSGSVASSTIMLYYDYQFSKEGGYDGGDGGSVGYDTLGLGVGMYKVTDTHVIKITSLARTDSGIDWEGDIVASCERIADKYTKGSTPYGKLFADEGELPEAGTLVAGSSADEYCVLKISGAYYYYEIVG